jgi:AcrR family transcriptional regulator
MSNVKDRSYHHGNLEQALLAAGLREARETGAKNLGVNALAKEVKVSPMAVYRHFSSAQSLRANISQLAREELARQMLVAISAQTEVKDRFQSAGRAYIQFALNEPGLYSVAFAACDEGPDREDSPSAWSVFQDSILDLCNAGLIDASEVESVGAFAWATVHGYATLAGGNDPIRPKTNEQTITDLLERIWSGITQKVTSADRPKVVGKQGPAEQR